MNKSFYSVFSITIAMLLIGCTAVPASARATVSLPAVTGDEPLYLTTMTHMEGGFTDDRDQGVFLQHVEQLHYGIALANEYNAKLTIESELPFAIACEKWDLNMMQEALDAGMGVGTHSDVGFKELLSVEQLAFEFARCKSAVDRLVGAENNRGTSGGGSATDWVLAATQAGFQYMDGIVGMHYLSMPIQNRPSPLWTDDYIRSVSFHEGAPLDLYERIYPILMKDAIDFENDADGTILVLSGEIGRLDLFAEGGSQQSCPRKQCEFTNEDVDVLMGIINEIDQNRDHQRMAKLTIYLPSATFVQNNEPVLRYFFSQMQNLQNQGVLTWATQGEVYDAYS